MIMIYFLIGALAYMFIFDGTVFGKIGTYVLPIVGYLLFRRLEKTQAKNMASLAADICKKTDDALGTSFLKSYGEPSRYVVGCDRDLLVFDSQSRKLLKIDGHSSFTEPYESITSCQHQWLLRSDGKYTSTYLEFTTKNLDRPLFKVESLGHGQNKAALARVHTLLGMV